MTIEIPTKETKGLDARSRVISATVETFSTPLFGS
jgi:hypothetical protein